MSIREVKISDIATMKYGKMPPKEILSDYGYPVFSGYRVTGYAKEYLYSKPMLVVVARGVGGTGDVRISPSESWITNLSIVLDLDEDAVDQRYLQYLLGYEHLKDKLNTGAAQAQITIENLGPYKIKIHNLAVQKEIVAVISTYDDLIENNKRRIKLLEESARLLYREWFVQLRFPGHEHTRIVDGVPEGWERGKVSDIGTVITGKTPSTKESDNYGGNIPFIKTPDMHKYPVVVSTEQYLSEKGANTQENKFLPKGSIMVSCIGSVGVVALNGDRAQTNQQINTVIPKKPELRHYAFFALCDIKPRLEALGGGATMPNVNKSKFESIPILIPHGTLLRNYDEISRPVFEQMKMLISINNSLSSARDLLLPRLMDGRVEIVI